MVERLVELQKVLDKLTMMVEAMMPEAQRLMEQGKDHEWHKVTGMLEKVGEAEVLVRDMLTVETGDPDFGQSRQHLLWGGHNDGKPV
jgi:hypothetical protein